MVGNARGELATTRGHCGPEENQMKKLVVIASLFVVFATSASYAQRAPYYQSNTGEIISYDSDPNIRTMQSRQSLIMQ